ncbi:oligomeric, coiled-coil, peripheral membrane protein [Vermiconidia calcicola]|uniref:Oligomeric, coiled-coil, peripheral membrane protein n=1 Tax=Vermiconidia calcicola TaxID=1690605 RepID=A0ACC3NWP0_9PEZI|nr:oligomeric, coiled-coil, peripheral membrane protein [Vermiconidia calcicola]
MGATLSAPAPVTWTPYSSTTVSLLEGSDNISLSRSRLEVARMSTTIYIGHSGRRLILDPSAISTVDALKPWLQSQAGIQPRSQILLTSQGKQVRTQTLLTENELFVFDSSRLNSKNAVADLASASDEFDPRVPPDTITNQNDLQAWQSLFRSRRNWAASLLHGCESRAEEAQRYQDEQVVIERCLGVAVASLQQHLKSAEQKYGTVQSWSEEVLQEQDTNAGNWEANLDSLRSIPARQEFARFLQPTFPGARRLSLQENTTTLQSFVDATSVRKAASGAKSLMTGFAQKVVKMREDLNNATKDGDELLRAAEQMSESSAASNSSEPAQLLEEIDIVVKKMASDLEHVQSLARTPQSVSQASKMALLHTRNYLPNLSDYCAEMNDLVQRTCQQRNNAADTAFENMRTLAKVESVLSELYQNMKSLELPQDEQQVLAALNIVSRLPSVYGALLVESVRRREWVAKMRRDAATLQEEVAVYKDEEDKRRKRWVRSVEDVIKAESLRSNVLGIELSLFNEGGTWPMVTREELQQYCDCLTEVYGPCPVTEEMAAAIKDLDQPTRKQIKHAKAFKNGSMHEAAFGDTSLLLRGDDQNKSLRDMNTRLEEELKGQKSRVRKLEDLLHRSSHIGRAGSADLFTPQSGSPLDRNMTSPAPFASRPSDELPRNSSLQHRRKASVQGVEEQKLARRVVDLEKAAQKEASGRKDSDAEAQKLVEEAISTKKDLMENMEAQQREFATERRNLEADLAEARDKVEELESDLERLMGSRDDEKTGADARVAVFEAEIARLKEDASGHAARAANEHDRRAALERKLQVAETARAEVETQVQRMRLEQEKRQEAESEQLQLLATAYAHLAPSDGAPGGIAALSAALEDVSRRSAAHAKDLEEAIAFAKCENESLWSSNERQKNELASTTQNQSDIEDQARQTQERLASEEARAKSLEQQLGEEKEQLRILRTKFAEGETGSDALQQRVAEEEARTGRLSSELAEANSHIISLDVELMRLQKKHKSYHATAEASAERLKKSAEHAKEVSQRLFAQNSRLGRLLERLGLVISYQDDAMLIERASKLGSSTTMIDPYAGLNRTISLTSPPPTRKSSTTDEPSDFSILHWSEAETVEEETAQFEAYLAHISRFNVETFGEAVVKRVRDFEYTARKYNKEAKESVKRADAYKERSLKLKTEAHTKIAVKDFKEGDLALFLPTRGQAKGAWAAFNVGCPHYFLAEKDGMRLGSRDYIVARINKIEQKVVDLSKTLPQQPEARSVDEASDATPSFEDDNPFDLSDGLTWWMVHATEERGAGGAPTTPGLGKSTVAAANVDARGSIRIKRSSKGEDATKHLNKSLDSRRSSSNSKKSVAGAVVPVLANAGGSPIVATSGEAVVGRQPSESQASLRPPPAAAGGNSGLGIITDFAAQPQNEQESFGDQSRTSRWLSQQSPAAFQVAFEVDTITSATLGSPVAGESVSSEVARKKTSLGVIVASRVFT